MWIRYDGRPLPVLVGAAFEGAMVGSTSQIADLSPPFAGRAWWDEGMGVIRVPGHAPGVTR